MKASFFPCSSDLNEEEKRRQETPFFSLFCSNSLKGARRGRGLRQACGVGSPLFSL